MKETVGEIAPLLHDRDNTVRASAIVALVKFGAADGVADALPPRIHADAIGGWGDDSSLRAIAILAKVNNASAVRSARRLLNSWNYYMRHRMLLAIADLGVKEMIPSLKPLLEDGGSSVRASAYIALTELGEKIACSPEMLRDLRSAYNKRFLRETWGARYDAALRRLDETK